MGATQGTAGRGRLVALAIGCTGAFVGLYVAAIRTEWGQRLDQAAITGGLTRPRVQDATEGVLATISVVSLAVIAALLMFVALARARWRLAGAVGVAILGANLTTQLLKRTALTRPDLAGGPNADAPTFPSGHATVAMSLAVAFVLVVPVRRRAFAGFAGAAYAAVIGTATLTASWHRPSDAIGGFLVAVGWAAAAGAVVAAGARRRHPGSGGTLLGAGGFGLIGVAAAAFAAVTLAAAAGDLERADFTAAYGAGIAAISGTALALVALLLGSLRGITLDPVSGRDSRSSGNANRARNGGGGGARRPPS